MTHEEFFDWWESICRSPLNIPRPRPLVCQQADCVGGYLPTEEGDRYRCPDCAALSAGTAAFAATGSRDPKAVSE